MVSDGYDIFRMLFRRPAENEPTRDGHALSTDSDAVQLVDSHR
jgi:hypothetical protein